MDHRLRRDRGPDRERAAHRRVRDRRRGLECFFFPQNPGDQPRPRRVPPDPAGHVADREGSDRRRHGVVGRRPFLRQARLGQAARRSPAAPFGRRAGLSRRPGRGAVRDVRRLGDHARAPGPAAARVAVHQGPGLPRHDHPEELRRHGLLRARAFGGGDEALDPLGRRGDLGDGAELARAGRAAAALWHRAAEDLLPAAPRQGPGNSLLRAHQPRGGLRCGIDSRLRRGVQRRLARQGSGRHARHLGQALHHARPDCDAAGPGVQAPRSGEIDLRQSRSGHYLRAGADQHAGREHRPAPSPAQRGVPERSELRQGRVHAARLDHRRPGLRGQGLDDADGLPGRGPRDLAAHLFHRRSQGADALYRRLRAGPQPVQDADRQAGRRRGSARPHRRQLLRDGRDACHDRRLGRPRREAGGAVGDRQVPHDRARAPERQRASARTTGWAAATR